MIRINLLPIRQLKKKQQLRNEVAVFVSSLIALCLIIGLVALNTMHSVSLLQERNTVLAKKKASYQPILNEIEKLKKDKAIQETKLEVIKQLKAGSQKPVRVLNEIARLTPSNRLWLTSMKQTASKIKLSAIALDNATIAQYMEKIASSGYFSNAELSRSSQVKIAGASLKKFSLTISVTTPQKKKVGN